MALTTYQLYPSNRSAREVSGDFMFGQLDMNPPYQRNHVWTVEQRMALVESWIQGIPCGAVILNKRDTEQWREATGTPRNSLTGWGVVDGKQRIETARQWFTGALQVPSEWFEDYEVDAPEGLVSYLSLSLPAQRHQGQSWFLPVIEATLPSPEAEAELFLRVNSGGTAQVSEIMEHARKLAGY